MTYYYIDIENVGMDCLKVIVKEDPRNSRFFIVLTTTTPCINWAFWRTILPLVKDRKYNIELVCVPGGPQAADKQILVDLACRAAKCPTRDYVVVSKDKGFMYPMGRIADMTHANVQVYNPDRLKITTDEILKDLNVE